MKLNNLRIATRLSIGFGAVLGLLLVIVALCYNRFGATDVGLAKLLTNQQQAALTQAWYGKTQLNVARAIAVAKSAGKPAVQEFFDPLVKSTSNEINVIQQGLESTLTLPEMKALMGAVAARRAEYIAARNGVFDAIKRVDYVVAGDTLKGKMLPAAESYLGAMEKVQALQNHLAEEEASGLNIGIHRSSNILLILFCASVVVGVGMSIVITRSVTAPLHEALETARTIAASDLSQTVASTRKDELGDLLRMLGQMQDALRGLVQQVRNSTDSIGTASAEIAVGTQDLSARTEQTASNLQQTASSMEQVAATIKQSADAAREANQLATSATEVAIRGGTAVAQVVEMMDDINASSEKIADIIGVIDGIAFQTNILALNAAVEAARAGEQGRGFAVVATEVRALAARSADAARDIKGLIGTSVDRVESGTRMVASAGVTMEEIVNSVKRVSAIIGEITSASAEQSHGIAQINGAVTQLDQMTQQNAALVEESAAAAESLKDQAHQLSGVVATFQLER